MEKITIKGRSISRGVAEGEALVTDKSFGFSHGIDPHTGKISDEGHEWMGQDARDKVLVFPYGKGSTSGGLYVLEAAKWNNAPLAVINLETEPVVALMDGQLSLRVIDLPFDLQKEYQDEYVQMLNAIRESNALLAGYIDRPRSTFVFALLHLAQLGPDGITEENLRQSPFRNLTDIELFQFLGPGERSAIFTVKAKGLEKYAQAGHTIHFFYLNVSQNEAGPKLARIEIPAWMVENPTALDIVHAVIIRQARINGGYPYVLARAHELAVISNAEREAVEIMLAVEMRRHGLTPALSPKQYNKTLLTSREGFSL